MIKNPSFDRRSLLKGLTLGAGASFIAPLVNRLVREAQGQADEGLRLLIVSTTNGFWPHYDMDFIGEEKQGSMYPNNKITTDYVERTDITIPLMFDAFAGYRDRLLMVDGLPQREYGEGHYGGPQFFSGTANHITVDQWIADRVSHDAPFKWVGVGYSSKTNSNLVVMDSAKAGGEPVPFITSPAIAYQTYFGHAGNGDEAQLLRLRAKRQAMLDFARDDIQRAKVRLAGEEAAKFDQYLESVAELDRRHKLTGNVGAGCSAVGGAEPSDPAAQLALQYDLVANVLSCGMTRVAWMSVGGNEAWGLGSEYCKSLIGVDGSLHNFGHGDLPDSKAHNSNVIRWNAAQTARVMDKLAQTPLAGGNLLDKTLVMFVNENGTRHHNRGGRSPVLFLGNAGGKLKADGRYIRFPLLPAWNENSQDKVRASSTSHGLPQLWNTLAHVFGAPKDDFGQGGIEVNNGPLPQLMV